MFSEGSTEFKHSKSITKPYFQQEISVTSCQFIRNAFFFKEEEQIDVAILFKWQLGNLSSSHGHCAMTVSVEGYFQQILGTH